jgi:hypothetical protein
MQAKDAHRSAKSAKVGSTSGRRATDGKPVVGEDGMWVAEGGSNSVVESQPSKLLVAGSIPVSRSIFRGY